MSLNFEPGKLTGSQISVKPEGRSFSPRVQDFLKKKQEKAATFEQDINDAARAFEAACDLEPADAKRMVKWSVELCDKLWRVSHSLRKSMQVGTSPKEARQLIDSCKNIIEEIPELLRKPTLEDLERWHPAAALDEIEFDRLLKSVGAPSKSILSDDPDLIPPEYALDDFESMIDDVDAVYYPASSEMGNTVDVIKLALFLRENEHAFDLYYARWCELFEKGGSSYTRKFARDLEYEMGVVNSHMPISFFIHFSADYAQRLSLEEKGSRPAFWNAFEQMNGIESVYDKAKKLGLLDVLYRTNTTHRHVVNTYEDVCQVAENCLSFGKGPGVFHQLLQECPLDYMEGVIATLLSNPEHFGLWINSRRHDVTEAEFCEFLSDYSDIEINGVPFARLVHNLSARGITRPLAASLIQSSEMILTDPLRAEIMDFLSCIERNPELAGRVVDQTLWLSNERRIDEARILLQRSEEAWRRYQGDKVLAVAVGRLCALSEENGFAENTDPIDQLIKLVPSVEKEKKSSTESATDYMSTETHRLFDAISDEKADQYRRMFTVNPAMLHRAKKACILSRGMTETFCDLLVTCGNCYAMEVITNSRDLFPALLSKLGSDPAEVRDMMRIFQEERKPDLLTAKEVDKGYQISNVYGALRSWLIPDMEKRAAKSTLNLEALQELDINTLSTAGVKFSNIDRVIVCGGSICSENLQSYSRAFPSLPLVHIDPVEEKGKTAGFNGDLSPSDLVVFIGSRMGHWSYALKAKAKVAGAPTFHHGGRGFSSLLKSLIDLIPTTAEA